MHKPKELFLEIKKLDTECNQILQRAKFFDRTHGWSLFILVFGILPILLTLLSHIIFDTLLYNIIDKNLYSFFIGLILLLATLFYVRDKSSKEYDKLFLKQSELSSLQVRLNGASL